VIPEHGSVLMIGIVIDGGLAGRIPGVGIAVAGGGGFGAVQVDDGANFGLFGLGSVDGVVDGKEMLSGKFVGPFDEESLAAAGFEGGAG